MLVSLTTTLIVLFILNFNNNVNLGQYNIDITHFGKHLKGSPFISYVYDASKVKINDLPEKNSVVVHKPVSFKCKCSM